MKSALSHIRVLDLSRALAGPWCTQNLADLGADVIKVERPGRGDETRTWGPPWIAGANGGETRDSTYFAATNRGKRSVAIDLAHADGQALVRELAASCDVLVENFKVGDLARYGLDYQTVRAINPAIVYCSITGYGQDGPRASKPGYDFVFQAESGLMSITGERDDRPGGGPQKVGIAVADVLTGMYASVAVLAALNHRSVSGEGQYIDMALLDCMVAFGGNQITGFFRTGEVPHRYGNAHASLVPYEAFPTADGHVVIAIGNDIQWKNYCEALGRDDLAADPKYRTMTDRIAGREALTAELAGEMRKRPTRVWIAALEARGVPCGAINNYAQVFEDAQVQHRGLRVDMPRADGGAVATIASPLRLVGTPPCYDRAPPFLGEHTREVLRDVLGKSADEIERLRGAGVVEEWVPARPDAAAGDAS